MNKRNTISVDELKDLLFKDDPELENEYQHYIKELENLKQENLGKYFEVAMSCFVTIEENSDEGL